MLISLLVQPFVVLYGLVTYLIIYVICCKVAVKPLLGLTVIFALEQNPTAVSRAAKPGVEICVANTTPYP